MKKYIYIFIGFTLFTISSCKKEEIRPNMNNNQLSEDFQLTKGFGDDNDYTNKSNTRGSFGDGVRSDSTFTITDPNRDEDDDRKIKKK
nr:hypothetical protein [uncultured Brumimicrobium sp.]